MEFFKANTNIDFLGSRRIAMVISSVLVLGSLVLLTVKGLNLGIDFTGGTLVELQYAQPANLDQIRATLNKSEFAGAIVQYFGTAEDVMVRLAPQKKLDSAAISNHIINLLGKSGNKLTVKRVEYIGAQVGSELAEDGGLAMIYALLGVLVYVALRFKIQFSVGAIVAVIHDPIITVGFFSLTGMTFDLTVLAAVLAVIGYSLNDTIVVFDRVREDFRKMRVATPVEVFNKAINETLSRTIMTSFATLLVVIALFFWGGKTIHGFAAALIVGIVVGTYSSIYVASPIAIALGVTKKDLMPVEKEGAKSANHP